MGHPSPFSRGSGIGGAGQEPGLPTPPGRLTCSAACPGVAQLLALVQSHVPGARLVKELPHELVLALPYQGALDGSFPELFRKLDQRLGELGLAGFGISDTSLEEVWLLGEVWGWQEEGCLEEVVLGRMKRSLPIDSWESHGGGRAHIEAWRLMDPTGGLGTPSV